MDRGLRKLVSPFRIVALLAVAAVWAGSYPWPAELKYDGRTGFHSLMIARGGVYFARYVNAPPDGQGLALRLCDDDKAAGRERTFRQFSWSFGFGLLRGGSAIRGNGFGYSVWRVPLWPAAVLLAALASASLARALWLRRRRMHPGLCPCCGYDLRATPYRCPECGTAVAAVAEGKAGHGPR